MHPAAHGPGIGKLFATGLERDAAACGARSIQTGVYALDAAACRLFTDRLSRCARLPRDAHRARCTAADTDLARRACASRRSTPSATRSPSTRPSRSLRGASEVHPRDFEFVVEKPPTSERFDPALWCVVRAGDEVAAGNDLHCQHVRRRLRPDPLHASPLAQARHRRGAARGRVRRLWEHGERSVGLGVDTRATVERFASTSAPETPLLGWVTDEKPDPGTGGTSKIIPRSRHGHGDPSPGAQASSWHGGASGVRSRLEPDEDARIRLTCRSQGTTLRITQFLLPLGRR